MERGAKLRNVDELTSPSRRIVGEVNSSTFLRGRSGMSNLIYNNEKGFVLPAGLMFLAIISILGATAVIVTTTDLKIGGNYKTNVQAFYNAEAGLAIVETELINDLDKDQDLSNNSFEATSGTITITPSSTVFYTLTGFNNIPFGAGAYTIQFKNYAPDPTKPAVYDPASIWVRPIGTCPNSSTVTLESYFVADNISPWNNAIFSGGSGGTVPITGNVVIAGSIHILGDGLDAADTVFNNRTGDCRNTNVDMSGVLAAKIDGGTTSDLKAKFRVKNGCVNMEVGSADIGSAASPFKGIYVTDGDDGNSDGVNDDIIGGDNAGAGQNLYADKGATSAKAYDLGDYNITMPSIETAELDAACLDLTVGGGVDEYVGPVGNQKGLIAGALELTGDYKPLSVTYFPNIDQNDVTTFEDSNNAIRFNSITNILEIKGIVKVSSLNISDAITYSGNGTIYTTGTTLIDGNILPDTDASYPTTNVFGVVSTGNMTLGVAASQLLISGAYYTAGTAISSKQTELAGTIVCKNFNITAQVPKIWQVQSLSSNLPPGMPGSKAVWVFTDRTWREVAE